MERAAAGTRRAGSIPLNYSTAGKCSRSAPTLSISESYLGCAFERLHQTCHWSRRSHCSGKPHDGSNISQTAIKLLQQSGPKGGLNQGFYIPSVPFGSNGLPLTSSAISFAQPTRANEDQYLGNLDYVDRQQQEHDLQLERFFTSKDPQNQSFVCLDGNGSLLNN